MCGVAPIFQQEIHERLSEKRRRTAFVFDVFSLSVSLSVPTKIVDGIFDGSKIKQIQKNKQSL